MDTAEIDAMVEQRLAQYREVPDLLEWHLPIGAAVLQLIAENRPLTPDEVASVLGWAVEEVTPGLEELLEQVGVERDCVGHVRAAHSTSEGVPLPLYRVRWVDTGNVVTLPGCASDALSPVLSAGRRARIELSCPAMGD